MKKIIQCLFAIIFAMHASFVVAMGEDDPLLLVTKIKKFEIHRANEVNDFDVSGKIQLSAARDLQKYFLTIEAETEDVRSDNEVDVHLEFSQVFSAYWDATLGVKKNYFSEDEVDTLEWFSVGLRGLLPYFIETQIHFLIGSEGRSAMTFELEKEWMLTQRWHIVTDLEMDFYGFNDAEYQYGSSLSSSEFAIKLAYGVTRNFNPYLGIKMENSYGKTKRYLRQQDEETGDRKVVLGFSAWF